MISQLQRIFITLFPLVTLDIILLGGSSCLIAIKLHFKMRFPRFIYCCNALVIKLHNFCYLPTTLIFLKSSKWVQNISPGSFGTIFWKSWIVRSNNSFPFKSQSLSLIFGKLNCLTAHCTQCLTWSLFLTQQNLAT